ncbi:MAG: C39 family peptidase [Candidatus Moranbacteria bacterium]|nr:C39 family peptidase [Candidatus Moranbacteria bacterium]
MMKTKIIIGGILGSIGLVSFFLWSTSVPEEREMGESAPVVALESVVVTAPPADIFEEPLQPEPLLPVSFLIAGVPFTVQAPAGQWQDPLYQDACEEASLAMARAWVEGETLTVTGVTEEIAKLAVFEKKQFGHAVDTSIQDTTWLLENYHGIGTGVIERDITIDTIKRALASEKIVIVPTDGRKLKNPNFKQPGPARHMLVITGYESETKEFIVNDPGTRKGEGYRYGEDILYGAIIDYETGYHVPLTSTDKVMLVVGREE